MIQQNEIIFGIQFIENKISPASPTFTVMTNRFHEYPRNLNEATVKMNSILFYE